MDKSGKSGGAQGDQRPFEATAAEAIERAAGRLNCEPHELAERLREGVIADLIEELDLARRLVPYPTDATRITRLLEQIGMAHPGRDGSRPGG